MEISLVKQNSQVAEWVNAKMIQVAQSIIVKVAPTGSIPVLTTKIKSYVLKTKIRYY